MSCHPGFEPLPGFVELGRNSTKLFIKNKYGLLFLRITVYTYDYIESTRIKWLPWIRECLFFARVFDYLRDALYLFACKDVFKEESRDLRLDVRLTTSHAPVLLLLGADFRFPAEQRTSFSDFWTTTPDTIRDDRISHV